MPPINEIVFSEESCITLDSNQSIHDCDSNCSCTSFITSTFLNEEYPPSKKPRLSPLKKEFFPFVDCRVDFLEPTVDKIFDQSVTKLEDSNVEYSLRQVYIFHQYSFILGSKKVFFLVLSRCHLFKQSIFKRNREYII